MDDKEINEIFKTNKKIFKISIILFSVFCTILIFCIIFTILNKETLLSETMNYYELISTKSDIENTYVEVKIKDAIIFKEEKEEDTVIYYCFIKDEEENIMIAKLKRNTIENINEFKKKDLVYLLSGYICNITNDIKLSAISQINNGFIDLPTISQDNYEEYLGRTYLDDFIFKESKVLSWACLIGTIIFLISILYFKTYFELRKGIKRCSKKFNIHDITKELKKDSVKVFTSYKFNDKIYLTDTYIINRSNTFLEIVRCQDLLWIYPTHEGLTCFTKDRTEICLFFMEDIDTKKEIITFIQQKNKNILIGYSKENQRKYKEKIKELIS